MGPAQLPNVAGEVAVKLTPSEMERVIDIVRRRPAHFSPGAVADRKDSRPMPEERSPACSGRFRHLCARTSRGMGAGRIGRGGRKYFLK